MLRVVYPGTFDPITLGHEDIVRRAAKLFDCVVVGIADSQQKSPWFSAEERVDLAREVLHDCPNIEVKSFSGLLMDFVREQQARVIVRGLRAVSDFEYEFKMAATNRVLCSEVETFFLTPSENFMFVSSTVVRELAYFGADLSQFVSPIVLEALRIRRQTRVK